MVAAHALGSDFESLTLLGADTGQGQFQTLARQDQVSHAGDLQAIEALGVLDQGGIATLAHGLDDFQHALVDAIVGHTLPAQQMIQVSGEVLVSGVESANSNGSGHGKASCKGKSQAPQADG